MSSDYWELSSRLSILSILRGWVGLHYMLATALAVESAVLHNFVWHERWTWVDRTGANRRGMLGRLIRFNLSTGIVSIASNLVFMSLFVDGFGLHYLPANLLSIGACSLVHFFSSATSSSLCDFSRTSLSELFWRAFRIFRWRR